jgi:hypothetical protein
MYVIPIWFEIIGILLLGVREEPNWNGNRISKESCDGCIVGCTLSRFNLIGKNRLRLCKTS